MNQGYYINTFNCEAVSKKIFFVASDMNMVLEYLLDRDEIILLPPPDESMLEMIPFGNVVVSDELVYLIPFHAKNIWKLCEENRWKKISDPRVEQGKFMGAIPVDNHIYLLGFSNIEIYKLNTLTDQITDLKINMQPEMLDLDKVGFLGSSYEIVNGKIFVPVMCANKILEIDTETDVINVIDVPEKSNGYSGIVYDGDGFWLAPRKGRYFVHYLLNGKVEEYELPKKYKSEEMYFGNAYREGDYIVFTAFYGGNFRFNSEFPNECEVFEPSIYYFKELNSKEKVIHERNGQTYHVDLNGSVRKLHLTISNTDRINYIKKYMNGNEIFLERNDFALDEYLEIVKHRAN